MAGVNLSAARKSSSTKEAEKWEEGSGLGAGGGTGLRIGGGGEEKGEYSPRPGRTKVQRDLALGIYFVPSDQKFCEQT